MIAVAHEPSEREISVRVVPARAPRPFLDRPFLSEQNVDALTWLLRAVTNAPDRDRDDDATLDLIALELSERARP